MADDERQKRGTGVNVHARIYRERPDWWLLIYADRPNGERLVCHHRRYWTWTGAVWAMQHWLSPRGDHAVCDGACRPSPATGTDGDNERTRR